MSKPRSLKSFLKTPLGVLSLGVFVFVVLVVFKPEPKAHIQEHLGPVAELTVVEVVDYPLEVAATGTVQPKHEAKISSQIGGRIVWLSDQMVRGGAFKKDEPMLRIDRRDFEYRLESAKADVAKAEEELEKIRARARVASQEWELMKDFTDSSADGEQPNPLVLFNPQLKTARASLQAARARQDQAELDLKRTTLQAPFNCLVREKEVAVGQYLRAWEVVGSVFGTDTVEVTVSLPLEELQLITQNAKAPEVPARVVLDSGAGEWIATMRRVLGDVDPRGRMNRAVIEVDDPYGDTSEGFRSPLTVGTFVRVFIDAGVLENVVVLPRSAVQSGPFVWVVDAESSLELREVEVLRQTKTKAILRDGLVAGDRVVVTKLAGAATGLKVRSIEDTRE